MRNNLSRSPSSILLTGIPVALDNTSAISCSVTLFRNKVISCISACAAKSNRFSSAGILSYFSCDIRFKSPARRATSISSRACSRSALILWVPCNAAFSELQTSSSSLYLLSKSKICSKIASRRLILASSVSFAMAFSSSFN